MTDLYNAIATVVALTLMQLGQMVIRAVLKSRFWRRVQERSQRYYEDPTHPATDPETAAEMALVDEQRASVNKVAARISNGHAKES